MLYECCEEQPSTESSNDSKSQFEEQVPDGKLSSTALGFTHDSQPSEHWNVLIPFKLTPTGTVAAPRDGFLAGDTLDDNTEEGSYGGSEHETNEDYDDFGDDDSRIHCSCAIGG